MEAPFPSHQSLARYAAQRLDLKLLEALLERLSRELVRGHARLLALVRWERGRRLLLPWGGVAGRGYAPDPRLGGKAREGARVRAREGWGPEVYRFRGVVEGVFGGMKTWLGGPTFGEALDGHGAGVFGAHRLRSQGPSLPSAAAPWVQGDLLGKPTGA